MKTDKSTTISASPLGTLTDGGLSRSRRSSGAATATPTSHRRYRWYALVTTLVLTVATMAGSALPAAAMQYEFTDGPYDMRPYVSTPEPLFGCYTGGALGIKAVTVTSPGNLNTKVYVTFRVNQWLNGRWVLLPDLGGSPLPGGKVLAAGQRFTFPAASFGVHGAGYFYIEADVDFHYLDGPSAGWRIGDVFLKPNTINDYEAPWRWPGGGKPYCYKSS